jgi:hypothetical protein
MTIQFNRFLILGAVILSLLSVCSNIVAYHALAVERKQALYDVQRQQMIESEYGKSF